ncbi:YSC84-related protein [Aquisalinus flavus]|nr:lipid-binding SYLF domain-containing protein [Aquisalinus flavus]
MMKFFAASASAAAMATAGIAANAQVDINADEPVTQAEEAATSAEELNQIQLAQYRDNGRMAMSTQTSTQTTTQTGTQTSQDWDTDTEDDWSAERATESEWSEKKMTWDSAARATLDECVALSEACNVASTNAAGVLVFPELTSASFIAGGTGGKGVLMVDGQPQGYYQLAAGSVGFQAGIEQISQVMTFNTQNALDDLTGGAEWRAGADAKITVINTGAQAKVVTDGDIDELGEVTAITFNQQGFAGGVSIEGIRIAEVTYDDQNGMFGDDDTSMMDDEDGVDDAADWGEQDMIGEREFDDDDSSM